MVEGDLYYLYTPPTILPILVPYYYGVLRTPLLFYYLTIIIIILLLSYCYY